MPNQNKEFASRKLEMLINVEYEIFSRSSYKENYSAELQKMRNRITELQIKLEELKNQDFLY